VRHSCLEKNYSRNCSWKEKKRKPEKAWAHDIISTDKHELATSTSKNSWDSSKWRETISYMMRGLGWLNSTSLDVGQCNAINGDEAD